MFSQGGASGHAGDPGPELLSAGAAASVRALGRHLSRAGIWRCVGLRCVEKLYGMARSLVCLVCVNICAEVAKLEDRRLVERAGQDCARSGGYPRRHSRVSTEWHCWNSLALSLDPLYSKHWPQQSRLAGPEVLQPPSSANTNTSCIQLQCSLICFKPAAMPRLDRPGLQL